MSERILEQIESVYESLSEESRLFIIAIFLGAFMGVVCESFEVFAIIFALIFVGGFSIYFTKMAYGCGEPTKDQPVNYFLD